MTPRRSQPRIILLQVRNHLVSLRREREWFCQRCAVDERHFSTINLVDRAGISWKHVKDSDVVMIGGAGAHSVHHDHPFTEALWEVVLRLLDENRPLFGSCWGHQFMARVLGSSVIHDPPSSEVGTFTIRLAGEGEIDPLVEGFPPSFDAQLGHNDRIEALPASMS